MFFRGTERNDVLLKEEVSLQARITLPKTNSSPLPSHFCFFPNFPFWHLVGYVTFLGGYEYRLYYCWWFRNPKQPTTVWLLLKPCNWIGFLAGFLTHQPWERSTDSPTLLARITQNDRQRLFDESCIAASSSVVSCEMGCWNSLNAIDHRIHGTIVYLPTWMADIYGTCRQIYQAWILWELPLGYKLQSF